MRYSRTVKILMVIILAAFQSLPSVAATSVKVHVSATVLPYVDFRASQNVKSYQVRSEDLQRGYIDLPNAITVNLRTNTQNGVHVMIENLGSGTVLVKESGSAVYAESWLTLDNAGYRRGEPVSKQFDSRIILPPDAQEGTYPFAVAMLSAQ